MPQDDRKRYEDEAQPNHVTSKAQSPRPDSNPWFKTPAPIKRLFDQFPLRTYPSNELPQRTTIDRTRDTLYIFTTAEGARRCAPSFNPGCLKWQAYLRFIGIEIATVPSNNHASPTGALPFLLPHASDPLNGSPIPSNKLQQWALKKSSSHVEPSNMRYQVYVSLLDDRIRHAWLYTLYLTPSNFESIAKPRYIFPTSSNSLVRTTLSHQLRQAAASELLKSSPVIDVGSLFRDAKRAWEALSELLGENDYFFAEEVPSLFDASVFAYTHLLLSKSMPWKDSSLSDDLSQYGNLVDHSHRILRRYFTGEHS